MCGIAGIISKSNRNDLEDKVNSMLDTIKHRGPDGQGCKIFENRIGLGHRRLAILDLSKDGIQPMNWNDRYWITYNGEIYNYLELRRELEKAGYVFATNTDTEVLLASFVNWGFECVEHFNGMWAFAIYDKETDKIFCSRDRYGIKPFYYSMIKDCFLFGSEIKEILSVKKEHPKANYDNLTAYLVNGLLDSNNETMFDGINQLGGGYNLLLNCKSLSYKITRWYDLQKSKTNLNNEVLNAHIFKKKFLRAVDLRLRSDVPVGSCLSGGLDSSAIVCAVYEKLKKSNEKTSQYTVTSCFDDNRYDEREFANAVVKKTGVTSYKVFPDMNQLFDELDTILWHMDEPFGSTSVYAQWNVFREAKKQGLTVMLDGQGADEQLAGYTNFYKVLFVYLLKKGKWRRLYKELQCYKKLREGSETDSTGELLLSAICTLLFPDFIRSKLNRIYRKKITGLPFEEKLYENDKATKGYKEYDKKRPQKYIYASMHMGMRALLHYEDRNSMAYSIESRVPFLDYELAEFVYSIPFEQKIVNGKTKNVLREGLKEILPFEIYSRISKLGFVTPEDVWMKEHEDFFYNELQMACDRLQNIVKKDQVLKWYKDHIQKVRKGDSTCFRIICAAHWANIFNVDI